MKTKTAKWAMNAAGAGTMALLLATPSFAQQRAGGTRNDSGRSIQTGERSNDNRSQNGYRENQRVTLSGKVRSFTRERDGYRVQLDQGAQSFWVPQSRFGSRAGDLRNGVSISLGGVFRGGMIYVDAVTWPGQHGQSAGYQSGYVRGVVDRIDSRNGTLWVRDYASNRLIAANLASGRNARSELRGLRPGEVVELSGHWTRGGAFQVASIDQYHGRR